VNETRWIIAPSAAEAATLGAALNIPLPLAQVLAVRGIKETEEGQRFLRGTADDLHDPYLMGGMAEAVDRLRLACGRGEKILIFGDYDVDGVLSVVMLLRALRQLGARVEYFIPDRLRDGYGLKTEHLATVLEKEASLVVSVDCGIKSEDFVREAARKGVDVIITDHHLPGPQAPPALAVLDPMLAGSGYPERALAGVGVVFKLLQALLDRSEAKKTLAHYLKLVAMGTISDVAELKGENRLMVKAGLKGLENVHNTGLQSLLNKCGLAGKRISEGDVSFRIGPRLNAAGRLETADLAVRLFLTEAEEEARQIVDRLDKLNAERQKAEEVILDQSLAKIRNKTLDRSYRVLILGSQEWHKGIVGIVASKLKDRFYRPVILFAYSGQQAYGSGRSIREFSLIDCLDACRSLFTNYGGHRLAVGCSLPLERMPAFRAAINDLAVSRLSEEDIRKKVFIDAGLDFENLTGAFFETYALLAPFGVGNPTPLFMTERAEIASPPQRLKERHIKFLVRQSGRTLEAVGWDKGAWADSLSRGDQVDLAYSLQFSTFLGQDRVQLSLRDVRRSE
jgi:single-stranded-DNA-specific exonuclease